MRFLVSWNYDNLRKPYKRLVHRLENELNTRLMCWRSVLRGTEGFKCPRQKYAGIKRHMSDAARKLLLEHYQNVVEK